MSKLIVSGCSYTDNVFTSRHGFTAWPQLLAEKLGMECINLGSAGAGNEYILSSLMDIMFKKDIGLMIAMWSEFQRLDFQIFSESKPWSFANYRYGRATVRMSGSSTPTTSAEAYVRATVNMTGQAPHPNEGRTLSPNPKWRDEIKDIFQKENIGTLPAMAYKAVRNFYTFQTMMEVHNIPYLQIQGRTPCDRQSQPVLMKHLLRGNLNLVDKINEDTFIGWPIMTELGGTDMDQVLDDIDPDREKLRIDPRRNENGWPLDSHPNEEGHKAMAEYIFKEIKFNDLLRLRR
jgi:hypothetical protein